MVLYLNWLQYPLIQNIFAKFGWNWLSGPGKNINCEKSLQTDWGTGNRRPEKSKIYRKIANWQKKTTKLHNKKIKRCKINKKIKRHRKKCKLHRTYLIDTQYVRSEKVSMFVVWYPFHFLVLYIHKTPTLAYTLTLL